jgi:exosortase/archaeosortase family protein
MFASILPIAIIGNGLRIAATGVLSTWMGRAAVEGAVHQATGYVAFFAMCAGMFALLWIGGFSTSRLDVGRSEAGRPEGRPLPSEVA